MTNFNGIRKFDLQLEPPDFKIDNIERYRNLMQMIAEFSIELAGDYPTERVLVVWEIPKDE